MRHDKNKHVVYTNFPDIRSMEERVFWGVFSWSIPKLAQRWVKRNSIVQVNGLVATPSDIVRDYLDFNHPHPLRAVGIEARGYEEHRFAPLFVRPTVLANAAYVDIKSTYYSIVLNLGWDVGYAPGRWLVPGRAPIDFPLPSDKSARNYLVSIGVSAGVTVWTGHKFQYLKGNNPHRNRGLWSVVMDTLHAIAECAISLGACYVHTDGYIIPTDRADVLIERIASFGLTANVRASGPAYVFGIGNYKVGEKQTLGFDPYRLQHSFDNLYKVDSRWLLRNIDWVLQGQRARRLYEQNCF